MFYNFLWTFNKEKPCVCIPTLLHYLLWCSFVWLWSHLVRHSRFRLSGKDARVQSCKGKSSKVRGQRSWSAKIWRQRVKKRRCAVAKAKKRYFYIAYLLRNCALSSSHLHTFAFTFFSLHNLMQVPYFSEICRRCYGVIVLNAVWRPSCLLWIKVQYYFTGLCHTGYLFTVLDKLYYYVLHIKCNARSNGRVSFQTSVTVQSESAQMVQCYGLNNKRKKNFIIGQSL